MSSFQFTAQITKDLSSRFHNTFSWYVTIYREKTIFHIFNRKHKFYLQYLMLNTCTSWHLSLVPYCLFYIECKNIYFMKSLSLSHIYIQQNLFMELNMYTILYIIKYTVEIYINNLLFPWFSIQCSLAVSVVSFIT